MTCRVWRLSTLAGVAGLAGLMVLAGCNPLVELPGQGQPPDFYRLSPPSQDRGPSAIAPARVVLVETPSVPGELAGSDIAVRADDNRINFIDGARWTDRTPDLLRRYLVSALRRAGPIKGIDGREDIDIQADYRLRIDVERFYAEVHDTPRVDIRLTATLLRNGPVVLLADRVFSAERSADNKRAGAIVDAFDGAMDRITADLEAWLTAEMAPAP
ncbi:cholesterol transport system auxiliary component [Rhodothalassium salexigens DSM 2132]|uniref:Cholesterol transport system auxiliary component n=1 Tax=Rhodothalassium salexigens DSM 2132 TaxID=1188247 RepID=A0A4R2PLT1_RHOSA|nr:ABC-type transport auxiliary lipoprotein family protein [Rhodothalassium salexigens]MBB4210915.1 cholesterol transport system auxiliary component [Rhodothalassium salexigens DSM 2132]MBK1639480.1 hypothetical protein [Rhodothalassium salexigens DSM 2132]TCP36427.1 cholesterol transport system auxiliary component [Rhodothalassium salexigens DSM 2132]